MSRLKIFYQKLGCDFEPCQDLCRTFLVERPQIFEEVKVIVSIRILEIE